MKNPENENERVNRITDNKIDYNDDIFSSKHTTEGLLYNTTMDLNKEILKQHNYSVNNVLFDWSEIPSDVCESVMDDKKSRKHIFTLLQIMDTLIDFAEIRENNMLRSKKLRAIDRRKKTILKETKAKIINAFF